MANGLAIEAEVFSKSTPVFEHLISYGFTKNGDTYQYQQDFLDDAFHMILTINTSKDITGTVIEKEFEEEYLPLRVAMNTTAFVTHVREAYIEILNDIKDKCFTSQEFFSDQANRMAAFIKERHGDMPDHPFKKVEGTAFRNPSNRKWYALLMPVEEKKIRKKGSDKMIEIVNVKVKPENMTKLIQMKGVYPAYHMAKGSWISIILDDSMTDDQLFHLINVSRALTLDISSRAGELSSDWMIPANPKYYDVAKAFKKSKTILWHQSASMKEGDYVYIYMTAPYSCLMYQCQIVEANIIEENKKYMKIKLLHIFDRDLIDSRVLKHYGVASVRGARKIPLQLKPVLEKLTQLD